jgi:hypothetical protein
VILSAAKDLLPTQAIEFLFAENPLRHVILSSQPPAHAVTDTHPAMRDNDH